MFNDGTAADILNVVNFSHAEPSTGVPILADLSTYSRINKIGDMDILPKVYYDPECFINIWCDYDVRNSRHFVTTDVRDELTNKYLGYDAYIPKYDVTLNFKKYKPEDLLTKLKVCFSMFVEDRR